MNTRLMKIRSCNRLLVFPFLFIFVVLLISTITLFSKDATAHHGMVASAHPLATEAGLQVLKSGGNAVDAALATAFVLSVVEPSASGLGGGGFILLKLVERPEVILLDFREMAPQGATPELFYQTPASFDSLARYGGTAVGIPGFVAGLLLVHEKYGILPLDQVLEPASEIAKDGFSATPRFSEIIAERLDLIKHHPSTAQIYLRHLLPPEPGTRIKNPDLARTIDLICKKGPSAFYEGKIARAIVRSVQQEKGVMVLQDLQHYQPRFRKPVEGVYRGYRIVSAAPPSGGGVHLIQLLNIMEGFDLHQLGFNSPRYVHILAEAIKMVLADKAVNMGDPDFFDVPVAHLTDKGYARQLREKIQMDKARFDYQPVYYELEKSGNTSHLSVVDERRNIIALTQSINLKFGSGITVEGTGILLNNEIFDFSSRPGLPNSVAPYKRPVSNMAPTIIFKDGHPILAIGTPGGQRIISALAQIIINIIDFQMSLDEAIEAPRIHAQGKHLYLEGRISQSTIEALRRLGHYVVVKKDCDMYFGGAQGILIDWKTGILYGGADSRRDGVAQGY